MEFLVAGEVRECAVGRQADALAQATVVRGALSTCSDIDRRYREDAGVRPRLSACRPLVVFAESVADGVHVDGKNYLVLGNRCGLKDRAHLDVRSGGNP